MRVVIQRVSQASVKTNNLLNGEIRHGFLIFLGIEVSDKIEDVNWLIKKIVGLRVFADSEGKMNLDLKEVKGSALIISQFTLHASTKKGNRPSFIKAARPDHAIPLYNSFINNLKENDINVETGVFGADMKVSLINDGPVTIIMDSKYKE